MGARAASVFVLPSPPLLSLQDEEPAVDVSTPDVEEDISQLVIILHIWFSDSFLKLLNVLSLLPCFDSISSLLLLFEYIWNLGHFSLIVATFDSHFSFSNDDEKYVEEGANGE